MGVGINFALLKEAWYGDPHFLFFFLKVKILVYEIKAKLSVKIYHSVSCHGLGKQIFFTFSKKLDIVSND